MTAESPVTQRSRKKVDVCGAEKAGLCQEIFPGTQRLLKKVVVYGAEEAGLCQRIFHSPSALSQENHPALTVRESPVTQHSQLDNNRLFLAPHLIRAWSAYKSLRIRSFYHTHTTHAQARTHARARALLLTGR